VSQHPSEEPFVPKRRGWGVAPNWKSPEARQLMAGLAVLVITLLLLVMGVGLLIHH
jgi:hypothetical protein